MSVERKEMLETLYTEKTRYQKLEQESNKRLLMLTQQGETDEDAKHLRHELEKEIGILRDLMEYIDFKIKILQVNEFAS